MESSSEEKRQFTTIRVCSVLTHQAPAVELVTTVCHISIDFLRNFEHVIFTACHTAAGFCTTFIYTHKADDSPLHLKKIIDLMIAEAFKQEPRIPVSV